MRRRVRAGLALATVGIVGGVALTAAALNPAGSRTWLVVCALVAGAMASEAVTSEPRSLIPAIVLALIPVAGLVSEGSPWWLGPPMAALLLLAGEFSALTWEHPARMWEDGSLMARLGESVVVTTLGLAAASVVSGFGSVKALGGTWAVVVASAGVVGLGLLVFRRPVDEDETPGARSGE